VVEHHDPAPQMMTPKGLRMEEGEASAWWDHHIYNCSKENPELGVSKTASTSAKSRDVHRLKKAVEVCGTVPHASVAVHDYLTRIEPQIGVNLGVVRHPDAHAAVSADILRQAKWWLHSPRVFQKNTNDALSAQKTILAAIIPPSPPVTATPKAKADHKVILKQIVGELDLSGAMKDRVHEASDANRDLKAASPETVLETKLIKTHKRKLPSDRKITPEFLDWFEEYLLTCEVTYDSPNRGDNVFAKDRNGKKIKDEENGGFLKARNRYYQRGLGWLFKHACLPVEE
jgi:hypothetical protein